MSCFKRAVIIYKTSQCVNIGEDSFVFYIKLHKFPPLMGGKG